MHGGGMGPSIPGNIPWTALRDWAAFHNLSRGEFHLLDLLIQSMDAEHRTWWIAQLPPPPKDT